MSQELINLISTETPDLEAINQELNAQGINVNFENIGGITPLRAAINNGHVEVVKLLLSHGADPLKAVGTNPFHTPMFFAEELKDTTHSSADAIILALQQAIAQRSPLPESITAPSVSGTEHNQDGSNVTASTSGSADIVESTEWVDNNDSATTAASEQAGTQEQVLPGSYLGSAGAATDSNASQSVTHTVPHTVPGRAGASPATNRAATEVVVPPPASGQAATAPLAGGLRASAQRPQNARTAPVGRSRDATEERGVIPPPAGTVARTEWDDNNNSVTRAASQQAGTVSRGIGVRTGIIPPPAGRDGGTEWGDNYGSDSVTRAAPQQAGTVSGGLGVPTVTSQQARTQESIFPVTSTVGTAVSVGRDRGLDSTRTSSASSSGGSSNYGSSVDSVQLEQKNNFLTRLLKAFGFSSAYIPDQDNLPESNEVPDKKGCVEYKFPGGEKEAKKVRDRIYSDYGIVSKLIKKDVGGYTHEYYLQLSKSEMEKLRTAVDNADRMDLQKSVAFNLLGSDENRKAFAKGIGKTGLLSFMGIGRSLKCDELSEEETAARAGDKFVLIRGKDEEYSVAAAPSQAARVKRSGTNLKPKEAKTQAAIALQAAMTLTEREHWQRHAWKFTIACDSSDRKAVIQFIKEAERLGAGVKLSGKALDKYGNEKDKEIAQLLSNAAEKHNSCKDNGGLATKSPGWFNKSKKVQAIKTIQYAEVEAARSVVDDGDFASHGDLDESIAAIRAGIAQQRDVQPTASEVQRWVDEGGHTVSTETGGLPSVPSHDPIINAPRQPVTTRRTVDPLADSRAGSDAPDESPRRGGPGSRTRD